MKTLVLLALVGFVAAQIQVQIPIQRPQQPSQHQFPQFPSFPQQPPQPPQRQPIQPRQSWRDGFPDARCNVPDDHNGPAQIISGTNGWDFFICWGGIGWPFMCAPGAVYDPVGNLCVMPGSASRFQPRPFNDDEEDNE